LLFPHSTLDTNPTIVLLLKFLDKLGLAVDVLFPRDENSILPMSRGSSISFSPTSRAFFYPREFSEKALFGDVVDQIRCFPPWRASPALYGLVKGRDYSLIIAADPPGVVAADRLNRWARLPLVYISFELVFPDEAVSLQQRRLVREEIEACKRVSLLVIQDEERLAAFRDVPGRDIWNVVKIPVAPESESIPKSTILREQFGIPSTTKIVLYSGSIGSWAGTDHLEAIVESWPDDFCLVVHSRYMPSKWQTKRLAPLLKIGRIFITDGPVSPEKYLSILSGADFGLATYEIDRSGLYTGKNLELIGLASGKVAYYAMFGLPILATALPAFDRYFGVYGCGRTFRLPSETGAILAEMASDYTRFSSGARRFYNEKLSPTEGMRVLCDKISALASPGSRACRDA
jgi:hypothetical protein